MTLHLEGVWLDNGMEKGETGFNRNIHGNGVWHTLIEQSMGYISRIERRIMSSPIRLGSSAKKKRT